MIEIGHVGGMPLEEVVMSALGGGMAALLAARVQLRDMLAQRRRRARDRVRGEDRAGPH